jgi:uncharacterized protein (TIGR03086 family)
VSTSRTSELLGSAVSYALAGAGTVLPPLLSAPTPCPGWALEALLDHLSDSMRVLAAAMTAGGVSVIPGCRAPVADPVTRLRGRAAGLLDAVAAAGTPGRRVAVAGRELTVNMVALAAAVEVTVHGWDIWVACGGRRPVPPGLASILLPVAPLLIAPGTRPGLFGRPVRLTGPACPGDQLVAFLGRRPARLACGLPGCCHGHGGVPCGGG